MNKTKNSPTGGFLFFSYLYQKMINYLVKTERFERIFGIFLTFDFTYAKIQYMLEKLTSKSIIGGSYGTY